MASNYDHTAWFYDSLARLIYGKSIRRAQTAFLDLIPACSTVLIVGGGTGWILEELAKVHRGGLKIIYVEVSARMTEKSRKRNCGVNEVQFVNQPIEDVLDKINANVIITPFLFDNHSAAQAKAIFDHIDKLLVRDGLWLNTDFQLTGKWWQAVLLSSMLFFFKLFGAVNNNEITSMRAGFEKAGYNKIAVKTFYSDFMRTDVWQKA